MNVFVDDIRPCPPEYDVYCHTYNECISLLLSGEVKKISLDHDLGENQKTGYDIAKFIEQGAYDGTIPKLEWNCHSDNPIGKRDIILALSNANKFWHERNL